MAVLTETGPGGGRACRGRAQAIAVLAAAALCAAVGDRVDDLDRGRPAVRQRVGGGFANLLAVDRAAEGRLGRVHVDRGAAFLAGGQKERDLLIVALESDGHRHARTDDPLRARRLADAGCLQNVDELTDPGFLHALLILGSVISAILSQVTFLPCSLNLLRDLDPARTGEVVELSLQPVVRLLRQPGVGVVARLGHGYSSVSCGGSGPLPGPGGPRG